MAINESICFLIVDDIAVMRKTIIGQLHTLGLRNVIEARNGTEALTILKKRAIDVILSAQSMESMSGIELLKIVRSTAELAYLPFILVTATTTKASVLSAINHGVSSVLMKPYDAVSLSLHVEKAISNPIKTAILPSISESNSTIRQSEPSKLTILVVDDMPDNLRLLVNIFKDDYSVQVAQSGAKALEICMEDKVPDLILLDVMMPEMDGFEVATKLRQHHEHIPIIFVTAMIGDETKVKGMELGAIDFVTKPINPDEIKRRVDNFMRYVELHKQLQSNYDSIFECKRLEGELENITQDNIHEPIFNALQLIQKMRENEQSNSPQIEQFNTIENILLESLNAINFSSVRYKIENDNFKIVSKPVEIVEILNQVVEKAHQEFIAKQLTIDIETNFKSTDGKAPLILGDASLSYSLLQGLINRTCEVLPKKSVITIAIDDNNPLKIEIKNKGVPSSSIRRGFFDKYINGNQLNVNLSVKLFAEVQGGNVSLEILDDDNLTAVVVCLPRFLGISV